MLKRFWAIFCKNWATFLETSGPTARVRWKPVPEQVPEPEVSVTSLGDLFFNHWAIFGGPKHLTIWPKYKQLEHVLYLIVINSRNLYKLSGNTGRILV